MQDTANALWNADISPTSAEQRTWRWWHFLALWIGMVMAVPGYMLVAGLIDQGMSAYQAIGTVLLGNLIVLGPMLLIGHAGAKFGIPYAVLVRASFGWRGARLPALARAAVACGWYGIQTWIGGGAMLTLLGVVVGHRLDGPQIPLLGIGVGQLLAFAAFWLVQLLFVNKGLDALRRLETWTAPLKVLICGLLLWWAISKAGGLGPILSAPSAYAAAGPKAGRFWADFGPALTAMTGFWAALALNIPDFTRFAKRQSDQILGQALGLPGPMAALAALAVVVTSATVIVFGKAIWDPVALAGDIGGIAVLIGLLIISLDTVSCNLAANLVGPAYDFASVWPARISYRTGGYITAARWRSRLRFARQEADDLIRQAREAGYLVLERQFPEASLGVPLRVAGAVQGGLVVRYVRSALRRDEARARLLPRLLEIAAAVEAEVEAQLATNGAITGS